ncbi:RtcB family protein [Alistipes sp. OttesenSCG-928-B03]|nr:RtcB family protein [Alistipes sp. OttesenSCG-928-B03]
MIHLEGKYNKDCKVFIDNVEEGALDLIRGILDNEISAGVPVRIMPDTHVGVGIVIGFTMPVTTMLNPNYIGVDIGCSVTSHKLDKRLTSEMLPGLDEKIRNAIPMGMEIRKPEMFDDWWIEPYFQDVNENIGAFLQEWAKRFGEKKEPVTVDREYITGLCKKIGIGERVFYYSIGTLGGGNHFIEAGESANNGTHYLTIHSGSRNFGLKVCNYHAKKMIGVKILPQEYHDEFREITQNTVPTSDIPGKIKELRKRFRLGEKEYLLQGDDMYEYLVDMVIAQTYARYNHKAMTKAIFDSLGGNYGVVESVYSMHNFIDTTDWIIRKGAIRAYEGEKMVIPFNMRDGLLICEGKSNPDWNFSAPHGAGRIMSRSRAAKTLAVDQFAREMEGIYSTSVCRETLDESPMAYKDKEVIIEAIKDTATILDTVKPILNIKAK